MMNNRGKSKQQGSGSLGVGAVSVSKSKNALPPRPPKDKPMMTDDAEARHAK
jgi:hypothetical protein